MLRCAIACEDNDVLRCTRMTQLTNGEMRFCELRRRRKLRFITGQMAINGYSTTPGSLCYYHFHQTPPRSSYIPHQISLRDLSPPVSPELSQTSFFLVLPLTKVHLPLTRFPFLTLARVPQRALNERLPQFCKIKIILLVRMAIHLN